jgi:hypothetical protein
MTRAKCRHCSKYFESRWAKKYCSDQCILDHNKAVREAHSVANRGPPHACPTCGTIIYWRNRQWCSNECIPKDARHRYRNDQYTTERVMRQFPELADERKRLLDAWKGQNAKP